MRMQAVAIAIPALAVMTAIAGCGSSSGSSSGSSGQGSTSGDTGSGSTGNLQSLLPAKVKSSGALTIATSPDSPPMESLDNGKYVGLDIDLANAIAHELNVKVKFTHLKFESLIPSVQSGRVDMAMSSISDLPERQQKVTFVDYFESGYAFVTPKGNPKGIKSLSDLCGLTMAAQRGTQEQQILDDTSKKCKKDGNKQINVKLFPDYSTAFLQLKTGRIDALLEGYNHADYVKKVGGDKVQMIVPKQLIAPNPYGMAVNKDAKMVPALKAGLNKIIDNGTYAKILAKWNLSKGAVKKATVNNPSS